MWKGKYRSMNNTKYGKGKGKLLPKIEEISGGKAHRNLIKIPYLREYKAHLFHPNIAFKIGVRIRFEGALDSTTNLNNIQLYRFLRNNV